MKVYKCFFIYEGCTQSVMSKHGLSAFADGFWLDKLYCLAVENCTECYLWIPPSKIEHIIVEEYDVDEDKD